MDRTSGGRGAALRWVAVAAVAAIAAGCATFPRAFAYTRVASPAMRDVWMEYAVLAPDDLAADERLPLVLFLHGGGDGPDAFDRAGLGEDIADAMRRGALPRMVIVLPEGDLGFWANWYDGSRRYEDWALDEVMPLVARRFHTAPCPEGCHLMGVSMGAEGAVRFAVHHPERFATVTSVSGPALDTTRRLAFLEERLFQIFIPTYHVFGPPTPRSRVERDDPYLRWRGPDAIPFRLLVTWGDRDRAEVREGSERFAAHLEAHAVPHASRMFEGAHAWVSWRPVLLEALAAQVGGAPLGAGWRVTGTLPARLSARAEAAVSATRQ